ncbi:MAG: tRNA (guanosine(37)-N1)-methyltransferase TrmD [Chloroflexi bacterium]|nr:tRNA (guanosine(37)-N1)-methyltransferase TrmD [Chloroflexota bacterium]
MADLRVDVLTIFPELFRGFLETSLLGKAQERGLVAVTIHDLRKWALPPHFQTDDYAYGGGPGMVMCAEPVISAVEDVRESDGWVVLLTPQGIPMTQGRVTELATRSHIVLICGRYEGVDDRVRQLVVDEEISVGDYVVSGGEVPAMIVIDAVTRLVPGVVGKPESVEGESHAAGLLSHPQYTRPEVVRGERAPAVLLGGNHAEIERWRHAQSLHRTIQNRPDLLSIEQASEAEKDQMSDTAPV